MNIVIVTPIYPGPDVSSGFTPVVHYFAKEWMKMGYNIKVISLPSTFTSLYYKVSNRFIRLIESINGHSIINTSPRLDIYNWVKCFDFSLYDVYCIIITSALLFIY